MINVICTNISRLDRSDYNVLYKKASAERKAKAEGFLHFEDSLRCVVSDALLRYALGTNEYTIEKDDLGKPHVRGQEDFFYNLSHSGPWVAIGYGNSNLGIDVQHFDSGIHAEAIAHRHFSGDEQKYVFSNNQNMQQRFLEIWTGKESYLKFLGTGLRKSLTSFSIFSLEPELRRFCWMLPGGDCLSVCTTDCRYYFTLLDPYTLL